MDFIKFLLDFILHLDVHLKQIIAGYGIWTYLILFIIIFMETGFVVTPFLPGDSLLFAAGAFAAEGSLSFGALFVLLYCAAVGGDTTNFLIGNYIGPRVFREHYRFLNKNHLIRTELFYEKHGGKTLVMARFVPIIRTFAPFVAGVGRMRFRRFISFSLFGGLLWVGGGLAAGYLFGGIPVVKQHFELVILGIVAISLMPPAFGALRHRFKKDSA